ncbi:carbohydrate ABC transporter permease [Paenibacillus sp. MMS20-IR301]|uniref:carbohydrate ABC transporter permease n=1 Tax=Paenibacillus sp. MMS20-IR301 TaxID=2895946 RepID=UPI0028EED06F|nr:carbohydrate ABC transporter permease [Paenibacillus sp. MMS20-IR301]WNS44090.1 carbohydrate ABC transporter permease [Paenibacillus sp. MMS20-IR301]
MKDVANVQSGLDRHNRIKPFTNILFNLVFIILGIIAVFPVLFVVMISLTAESSIQEHGYQIIPAAFSLDGYRFLYQQSDMILRALGISLFVTGVGTVLGVMLTTSMGYVMSRPQFRLKKFVTWLVFIPMIFNGGLVSSYFVTANLLHLKDSIWALILPLAVSSFNVIICKTFFRSTIPDALVESAKIDGASQLRIFLRIVLPISLPVLATIGLFLSFSYWNDWFQSMLYIDNQNMYSLQALLNKIMGQADYLAKNASSLGVSIAEAAAKMPKESARMAITVLIVLPIACAYPFFQKYYTSGLTIGAVKE